MNQMKTSCAGTAVAVFEGYADGEPLVTWLDRRCMPQPGARLYVGAAPMCERKTAKLEEEGYERTGYVLRQPGKEREIVVSEGGAVSWFTLEQWNWLMFNRDHVSFQWPKPLIAQASDADAAAENDRRYCEPKDFEGIEAERQEFEAWATGPSGPWLPGALDRDEYGYNSTEVREHWSMWANFAVRRAAKDIAKPAGVQAIEIDPAEVLDLLDALDRVSAGGAGDIPNLCVRARRMFLDLLSNVEQMA
jgi:hypothetical protein